jgi:hypothetical protein
MESVERKLRVLTVRTTFLAVPMRERSFKPLAHSRCHASRLAQLKYLDKIETRRAIALRRLVCRYTVLRIIYVTRIVTVAPRLNIINTRQMKLD